MGRRRRRSREQSTEQKHAEAQLELERAESNLGYRKAQLAEAVDELTALDGPGGWFAALMGKKATYKAEIEARIKAIQTEIISGRKRLIEAKQAINTVGKLVEAREEQSRERDAELEAFAERVRAGIDHPLKDNLLALESRIQEAADRLFALDDAVYACAGLTAAIGQVLRITGKAKSYSAMDAFNMDMPLRSQMTFLKTQEAKKEAANLPVSVDRFNNACAALGLTPLDIEVPDLGAGWDQLFFDNILTDLHHLKRLESFSRRLEDERGLVTETMLWVSKKRKEALADQESLLQQRRSLLDEACR